MRTAVTIIVGFLLAAAVLFAVYLIGCEDDWCFHFEWQRARSVQTFEECANRGYPILESYPRQCVAGGRTFVENVSSSAAVQNITVTEPSAGDTVTVPFFIRGEARVFENQLNYKIKDFDGSLLQEGIGTALAPDIGQFGPYKIHITSLSPVGSNGTIEVFDYSAKDGSIENLVTVPVQF